MNLGQINISRESKLITSQWIVFAVLNVILKLFIPYSGAAWSHFFEYLLFLCHIARDLLTSGILFYYSVWLVNKSAKSEPEENEGDLQKNLGTFAIEDFDVAMKSKNPLKIFRTYITQQPEQYKSALAQLCNIPEKDLTQHKLGETYFILFQLITVFNLIAF